MFVSAVFCAVKSAAEGAGVAGGSNKMAAFNVILHPVLPFYHLQEVCNKKIFLEMENLVHSSYLSKIIITKKKSKYRSNKQLMIETGSRLGYFFVQG